MNRTASFQQRLIAPAALGIGCLIIFGLAACKNESKPTSTSTSTSVKLGTSDPHADKLLTQMAKCKWDDDAEEFAEDCPADAAWEKHSDKIADIEDDNALAKVEKAQYTSILKAVQSTDKMVRRAGLSKLEADDKQGALVLVDAYKRESDKTNKSILLRMLGSTAIKHGVASLILPIYSAASDANKEKLVKAVADGKCAACVAALFKAATDKNAKRSGFSALAAIKPGMADKRACKLFAAFAIQQKKFGLRTEAINQLKTFGLRCSNEFDGLLRHIDSTPKKANGYIFDVFAKHLCNAQAPAKLRTRALASARTVAKKSWQGVFQMHALEYLANCDETSRKFIASFSKDKFLRSSVKDYLKTFDKRFSTR